MIGDENLKAKFTKSFKPIVLWLKVYKCRNDNNVNSGGNSLLVSHVACTPETFFARFCGPFGAILDSLDSLSQGLRLVV